MLVLPTCSLRGDREKVWFNFEPDRVHWAFRRAQLHPLPDGDAQGGGLGAALRGNAAGRASGGPGGDHGVGSGGMSGIDPSDPDAARRRLDGLSSDSQGWARAVVFSGVRSPAQGVVRACRDAVDARRASAGQAHRESGEEQCASRPRSPATSANSTPGARKSIPTSEAGPMAPHRRMPGRMNPKPICRIALFESTA